LAISFFFFAFLKYEKNATFLLFFNENMFGKLLGFSYMYENKTFFIFFCFERGNSFLKKK